MIECIKTSHPRVRLDSYLVQSGLCESREKAQRAIIAGWVTVNDETVRTVSKNIKGDEIVRVERPAGLFVSRGGEKLAYALDHFGLSVKDLIAADLGASTGGFTDCLLQRGAHAVYAIDVGYGQLDYRLRTDSRVVVMERTNVRYLEASSFSRKVDFIVMDVSFISILKLIDTIKNIFSPCNGIVLIKPQFEALRTEHKKGVVRYPHEHVAIITRVFEGLSHKGIQLNGLIHSPLKGPAGNIEFLLYFSIGDTIRPEGGCIQSIDIEAVVTGAHRSFASIDGET